jgi:hypothetical protein
MVGSGTAMAQPLGLTDMVGIGTAMAQPLGLTDMVGSGTAMAQPLGLTDMVGIGIQSDAHEVIVRNTKGVKVRSEAA